MREREREREKGSVKTPHSIQLTVHGNENAREALTRETSNEAMAEFRDVGDARAAPQQRNSARDTAEQEERAQQIASVIENLRRRLRRQGHSEAGEETRQREQHSVFVVSRTRCCKNYLSVERVAKWRNAE